MATEPRRAGVPRGRRWVRALALAGVSAGGGLAAAPPPNPLPPAVSAPGAAAPLPAGPTDPAKRVVAFIHGNVPVTRDDLGEFLIDRGGFGKLELLVNRKMIEIEANRQGVTVTVDEVFAGLAEDLAAIGLNQDEFAKTVLPRYGKTLYEWTADVIRPRLILGKMCRGRVQVTDDDVKRAFENRYGERREAQLIVWPKGPGIPLLGDDVKATAAAKPEEFNKLAASQPDEGLRKAVGLIAPVGRYIDGEDPEVLQALFSLKINEKGEGETRWVESPTKSTCVRIVRITPPDTAVTFEKVRPAVEKEVFDRKLNAEIPKFFAGLKEQANPTLTEHVPLPPPVIGPDGKPLPAPVRAPNPDRRVLAVVYHNMPVTREELGEFLIVRGGYEKLDLLVNRRIIDLEAAKRGVTVTPEEIDAVHTEDLKALGLYRQEPNQKPEDAVRQMKADFIKVILPKHRMSMFEWTEDVLKPRVILGKMVRPRVKVTDEDLKQAFEHRYGEKRAAKLIVWAKEDFRAAQKEWDLARKSDEEFDRIAKSQRDANLASAAGAVAPIGRYGDADNPIVEQVLFTLKPGEISQLFETPAGIVCVKCVKHLPADVSVTPDRVRPVLEKEVFEKKLAKEIPLFFNELKQQANPNLLLKGPPSQRENDLGLQQIIQQVGNPMPKK